MYQTSSNKVTLGDVMHALSNTLRFLLYVLVLLYAVFTRALPDITSGPEVRQILEVQAVRKPDVFLTGPDTLISKKKSQKKIQKEIFQTFSKKIFFNLFFSIFYISLLILSMSIFYTQFVYWEVILCQLLL